MYVDSIQLIPRWYSTKPYYTNVPSGFQGTFTGGAKEYPDIEEGWGGERVGRRNGLERKYHVQVVPAIACKGKKGKTEEKLFI